jgi:pimeloyl-ACP methyl ester carboxylesterase
MPTLMVILLKILLWILVIAIGSNFFMQWLSYAFYKRAKKVADARVLPIRFKANKLVGYSSNADILSKSVILYFGGSDDIAYNCVVNYSDKFKDIPFYSADYYGTQDSIGKMNLKSMQQTAVDFYDYITKRYPDSNIIVIGHSYGSGIAAYLASVRKVKKLFIIAGYRDFSDLYNKRVPVYWGPLKLLITNNIKAEEYAKSIDCKTFVIGSTGDRTLGPRLQQKVAACFKNSELKIFDNVKHLEYLFDKGVIGYIVDKIRE